MNRADYVFERFVDGSVLLDLRSGMLFRLNSTATEIWELALSKGMAPSAIASDLARSHGISAEQASADVAAALLIPERDPLPADPTELTYEPQETGFLLSRHGQPAFAIDTASETIQALPSTPPADYGMFLRSMAPKLVARGGSLVLHASAVATPEGNLWAFLGTNGAGKTTTARTFARNGFRLISEDKLVTRVRGGKLTADLEGEPRISDWIRRTRRSLELVQDRRAGFAEIAGWIEGPYLPIERAFLVDSQRRSGWSLDELGPSSAASEVFPHAFYGSALAADWRRQLSSVAVLARTAQVFTATVPDGINVLDTAIQAYIAINAS
jgi:energy-coupling factor transporter ATP-binding protein EcfA2